MSRGTQIVSMLTQSPCWQTLGLPHQINLKESPSKGLLVAPRASWRHLHQEVQVFTEDSAWLRSAWLVSFPHFFHITPAGRAASPQKPRGDCFSLLGLEFSHDDGSSGSCLLPSRVNLLLVCEVQLTWHLLDFHGRPRWGTELCLFCLPRDP